MKKTLFAILSMVVAAGSANADTTTFGVNTAWTTGTVGTVATGMFTIGAGGASSIDSIDIDLSHTWAGDLTITAGGLNVVAAMGGNTDIGIAGTGLAGDEAAYSWNFDGTNTTIWAPLGGGASGGGADGSGGLAAGTYLFSVVDGAGGDGGSVGNVTVNYTAAIPEPASALVLLGVAGMAIVRRRR